MYRLRTPDDGAGKRMGVAVAVSICINALALYGAGSLALTAAVARPIGHGIILPVHLLNRESPAEPTPRRSANPALPDTHRVDVPREPEKPGIQRTLTPKRHKEPVIPSPTPEARSVDTPVRAAAESLALRTPEAAGGAAPELPRGETIPHRSPSAFTAASRSGVRGTTALAAKTASPALATSEMLHGLAPQGAGPAVAQVATRAGSTPEPVGGMQVASLAATTATATIAPRAVRDIVISSTGSAGPRYGRHDGLFANRSTESTFALPIGGAGGSGVSGQEQRAPSVAVTHEAVGAATELRAIPAAGGGEGPGSGLKGPRAEARAGDIRGASGQARMGQGHGWGEKGGSGGTVVVGTEAAGVSGIRRGGDATGRTAATGSVNAGGSGPGALDAVRVDPKAAVKDRPITKSVVLSDSDSDDDQIARSVTQVAARMAMRPAFDVPDAVRARRLHVTVKVRVVIEADGRHTEEMVTSSGDDRMDRAVLDWMRGWKWEPARQDGKSVRSTRLHKVNIGQD